MDEDTAAFNEIMQAFSLPKKSDEEKKLRRTAIQSATKVAIEVPFNTMKAAYESFDLLRAMAEKGNPNSISDAGVGALCARASVRGAFLNIKTNAAGLDDENYKSNILMKAEDLLKKAEESENEILKIAESKIGK